MTALSPSPAQPDPSHTVPASGTTWTLPASAESVRSSRRQLTAQLREWRLPHLADDAALIVSEIVTNAVSHGAGPVWHTVRHVLTRDGKSIRIEVGDHGSAWSGLPSPRRPVDPLTAGGATLLKTGGRGLRLVEALASEWGAWRLPHGLVVWAVFDRVK